MDDFVRQTLDWVNHEREMRGIGPALADLPKGTPCSVINCPLANALCAEVDSVSATFDECRPDDADAPLPTYARQFVLAFDRGELTQYEDAE